jgi:hypothetical protein
MFFLFPLLYYNYSFMYLYKGYASYIHISRGYVKHKRLRTTALDDLKQRITTATARVDDGILTHVW